MNTSATHEIVHIPPAASGYRIELISDRDALLALRPDWDRLVAEAGIDHPFLSHEWIYTWWECFGDGKTLHVLLVRAGGKIIGIAPLMRSEKRMAGLRVRCLGSLYNPHAPRLDFIVAPGAEGVYRCLWHHLLGAAGEWDVLELPQLPADSSTLGILSRIAADDGYLVGVWHGENSPYLPFHGGWEGYLKRLSHNHRAKIRKGLNRLTRLGDVRLEVVAAGEQLAGALDDGLRIEAAAWKDKTGTAICSQPDVEKFYREFAERAAGMGALRLLFLTVAGARIAFAYALCHRNKLYVLKAGYDPAYARYSPYNLLCYLVFQDGFARGLDEYEFLGSNEAWKLDWTREIRPHDWLFILAPAWRTRLVHHIKFRCIPVMQRWRLYVWVRDVFSGRRHRRRRHWLRPAWRTAGVTGNGHLPQAPG